MKLLIGLTGVAQSGKDTAAKVLIKKHGFRRIGFADKVRDCLLALNPLVYIPSTMTASFGLGDALSNFTFRTMVFFLFG